MTGEFFFVLELVTFSGEFGSVSGYFEFTLQSGKNIDPERIP